MWMFITQALYVLSRFNCNPTSIYCIIYAYIYVICLAPQELAYSVCVAAKTMKNRMMEDVIYISKKKLV